jgi:hypothetical protein
MECKSIPFKALAQCQEPPTMFATAERREAQLTNTKALGFGPKK